MLDHAARQLRAAGFAPALIQANLVELECLRPERFDVCLCLFSTLGMIVGRENRQTVLKHAHRILAPGGKLLLHVHNLWFNLWNAPGRTWLVCDLARWLLGRPEAGDRAMPVHQGVSNLSLHLFTRRELRSQLCTAGFEKIRIDPISLSLDGKLALASLLPGLRAYGYFVRAEKAGGLGNPADFDH
jgi:SAM-dependent methyltransferase